MSLFKKYTLQTNLTSFEFDSSPGIFETYGRDLETVKSVAKINPRRVWTLVQWDDDTSIWLNGFWRVNRILYAITNEPGTENESFPCDEEN